MTSTPRVHGQSGYRASKFGYAQCVARRRFGMARPVTEESTSQPDGLVVPARWAGEPALTPPPDRTAVLPTLPPPDPPTQSIPVLPVRYRAAPTPPSSRSGCHLAGVTVAILGLFSLGWPSRTPSFLLTRYRRFSVGMLETAPTAQVELRRPQPWQSSCCWRPSPSPRGPGLRHSSPARGAGCSDGRGALRGTPVRNNE